MAQNRALIKNQWEFSLQKGTCVFISHKKEDEKTAKAIGDYLIQQVGVDIYLDLYDLELKEAVSVENDKKIVCFAQKNNCLSANFTNFAV